MGILNFLIERRRKANEEKKLAEIAEAQKDINNNESADDSSISESKNDGNSGIYEHLSFLNFLSPKYTMTTAKDSLSSVFDLFAQFFSTAKSDTKSLIANKKSAGANNFVIGLAMLSRGELLDARFRFRLANFFCKNSAVGLYYLAYSQYLSGHIKDCVANLKKSIKIRPSKSWRASLLLKEITQTRPEEVF